MWGGVGSVGPVVRTQIAPLAVLQACSQPGSRPLAPHPQLHRRPSLPAFLCVSTLARVSTVCPSTLICSWAPPCSCGCVPTPLLAFAPPLPTPLPSHTAIPYHTPFLLHTSHLGGDMLIQAGVGAQQREQPHLGQLGLVGGQHTQVEQRAAVGPQQLQQPWGERGKGCSRAQHTTSSYTYVQQVGRSSRTVQDLEPPRIPVPLQALFNQLTNKSTYASSELSCAPAQTAFSSIAIRRLLSTPSPPPPPPHPSPSGVLTSRSYT